MSDESRTAADRAVSTSKEGALLPHRDGDDWNDEELSLAARRIPLGDLGDEVQGRRAVTDDGGEWEVAPSTVSCNNDSTVKICPPYTAEWIECEPLHFAVNWTPSNSRALYAIKGPRDGYPLVVVMRRLTTGAGTRGYRIVYAGPYHGKRDLLPVSTEA